MAFIKCPECAAEISDKATACPRCGCPVQQGPKPPVNVAGGEEKVIEALRTSGKIAAIKLYRDQNPGMGLKEAKDGVEALATRLGITPSADKGCLASIVMVLCCIAGLSLLAVAAVRLGR